MLIILVATYIKEALAGELFATDGTKHLVRLSANLHFEIIRLVRLVRLVLVGHKDVVTRAMLILNLSD